MNFLFVDQILELESGKRVVGIKHVTAHDSYLKPGKNGSTQLLSCIVGEALGQLGAWCVMHANNFTQRPVAGVVGEVNIYNEVYLGDSILLETVIDSLNDEAVFYHSTATVKGEIVCTLNNALGPLLPMQDFNDPAEVKRQFNMIYRPGNIPTLPASHLNPALKAPVTQPIVFDKIIAWEKGKQAVAQKNISLIAPYFDDHFARKPVFPLSLLLECKLQLAYDFIAELFDTDINSLFSSITLRKVKMSDFVSPGQIVTTTLSLKEKSENSVILSFQSHSNDKRICVAEAEFKA